MDASQSTLRRYVNRIMQTKIKQVIKQSLTSGFCRVVYTDGSVRNGGKRGPTAGWGIYWGENDRRNSYGRVSGGQTSDRAEFEAIMQAAKQIHIDALSGFRGLYEIRTDSQNAVTAINRGSSYSGSNKTFVKSILESISQAEDRGVQISVLHICRKSQVGNKEADKLARKAANHLEN